MRLATLEAHSSDLGAAKTMVATETAVELTEVGRTTCVFLVREGDGLCTIWPVDNMRPADRGAALEAMGVDIDDPLRSPQYAMAYETPDGEIVVTGTSENGKLVLGSQFHILANI